MAKDRNVGVSVETARGVGRGGVQRNASACDAAAEKLTTNLKARKDMLKFKLQGEKNEENFNG